jgi:hypothetical protein
MQCTAVLACMDAEQAADSTVTQQLREQVTESSASVASCKAQADALSWTAAAYAAFSFVAQTEKNYRMPANSRHWGNCQSCSSIYIL